MRLKAKERRAMSDNLMHINKKEQFVALTKENKVVIVDFYANWCGPCKMLSPVIEKMAEKYAGKAVLAKCDVDECESLATAFGIASIPTLLFFKDGTLVEKMVGLAMPNDIARKIESYIN